MTLQAANAARQKAAVKHKIAAYISDYYAATKRGVCVADVIAAMKISKDTAHRSFRDLVTAQKIQCIGMAFDTDRDDIASNVRIYGPMDAAALDRKPPRKYAHGYAVPYEGKPAMVKPVKREPRTGSGQVGEKYVAPITRESGRKEADYWAHRDLALLAR